MDGLLGAIIGLAVAAVLAIINSMLSDRQKVAEGVRDQRIRTYPAAWERTGRARPQRLLRSADAAAGHLGRHAAGRRKAQPPCAWRHSC